MAYVETLPSGKYRGIYKIDGRKKSTGAVLRERDALAMAKEAERLARLEQANPNHPDVVARLEKKLTPFEDFAAYYKGTLHSGTRRSQRNKLIRVHRHILPYFRHRTVNELEGRDARQLIQHLVGKGLPRGRCTASLVSSPA